MKILIVSADRTTSEGHPQNLGDALLTDALAKHLEGRGHVVRVADMGEARRRETDVQRVQVSGVLELARAVSWSDSVVIGGGTLLADDQPERPFAGLPRLCLATWALARLQRRSVAVFGVGVDPVVRRRARLAIRVVLRSSDVWLRDSDSSVRAGLLAGRASFPLSGDVSLFALPDIAASTLSENERSGAVVALNRREAAMLRLHHVQDLRDRFGAVSFVSMDQGHDPDHASLSEDVAALMTVPRVQMAWHSAAVAIGGAQIVVASRMHAMYLAAMSGTPTVAVGDAPKVRSFVKDYGIATASDLEAVRIVQATVDSGKASQRFRDLLASVVELEDRIDHAN